MASTILIVGASRGLGLAMAQEYARRGWAVIGTVRDAGREALGAVGAEVETLDTTDEAAVDALATRLAGRTIDLLFVNAGISIAQEKPLGEVSEADFGRIMLVNAYAPIRAVDRLIHLVAPTGTVAVMSSGLGSIARSNGSWEIYRMSKAALNMGLKTLSVRMADARTYLCVTPGWVKTDMGGPGAMLEIEQSIPHLVDMTETRAGSGGIAFVNYDNEEFPW